MPEQPMTVEEAEIILDDLLPNWRTYALNELDFQAANLRYLMDHHPNPDVREGLIEVNTALNVIILDKKEHEV